MSLKTATLGEVCDIVSGSTPKTGIARFWSGDVPWATPKDLSDLETPYLDRPSRFITEEGLESCAARMLPVNSVLLSSRAPIGLVAINTVAMATNQGFKSLVPLPNKLNSKFLYHWLKSKTDYLQSLGNGATFKEISKAIVERIEIPLPPLNEQRRIAAILDEADALRRKRKRALELLDGLAQSIFIDMIGKLNPDTHGHTVQPLHSITTEIYRYPTYYGIEYENDGIPEIRGEMIQDDGTVLCDRSQTRYISTQTAARFPKTELKSGDLVMSVRGTIGKVGIVPPALNGANMTANLVRISPDRTKILPRYLWLVLRSDSIKQALVGATATTTIATIKASDLRNLQIIAPPISHQQRICDAIKRIDLEVRSASRHSGHLKSIFASLQHRAFTGQL